MNRGYEVTDFGGTGMLEIQKIDELRIFSNDEEAVEQAIKDGIAPENRRAIEKYCMEVSNEYEIE